MHKEPSRAVALFAVAIATGMIGFITLIIMPPVGIVLGLMSFGLVIASIITAIVDARK